MLYTSLICMLHASHVPHVVLPSGELMHVIVVCERMTTSSYNVQLKKIKLGRCLPLPERQHYIRHCSSELYQMTSWSSWLVLLVETLKFDSHIQHQFLD